LLDHETLQKTKNFGEQTAAARNDVIAKKIVSGLFQNRSGRPEDWTVSGPCHLYMQPLPQTNQTKNHCSVARFEKALQPNFTKKLAKRSKKPVAKIGQV